MQSQSRRTCRCAQQLRLHVREPTLPRSGLNSAALHALRSPTTHTSVAHHPAHSRRCPTVPSASPRSAHALQRLPPPPSLRFPQRLKALIDQLPSIKDELSNTSANSTTGTFNG